jgi:hypothetical protein
MSLTTELYETQLREWPREGRHILAHYDDSSIIVYQAYRPSIGKFAIENGRLGGPEFSFSRMSWIKPNFLWMMYRSGWGMKEGQEVTLALRIRRAFFDDIVAQAVSSSYQTDYPGGREAWSAALGKSEVRLQWDPDHSPTGEKQERRAIQLGLRGQVLEAFAGPELIEVIDLSDFVASQRPYVTESMIATLRTPSERVYPFNDIANRSVGTPAR